MIIYCNKCGWTCGNMPSLLSDIEKHRDKDHKCKPMPSVSEQKEKAKNNWSDWIPVSKPKKGRRI